MEAKKRGRKSAGLILCLELTKLADKHRIGMELFPQAQKMRGALGQEDLEYFYSNFGFDLTSDFLGDPYI